MSPRHQLVLSVAIIAAAIIAAWIVLFRNHALTPSVAMPAGPSLPEIGKQFDAQVETFNRLLEPVESGPVNQGRESPAALVPSTASDDPRSP